MYMTILHGLSTAIDNAMIWVDNNNVFLFKLGLICILLKDIIEVKD